LKEFDSEGACAVLQQFKDSNLSHVQNKSAFLCGVMKTYRQVNIFFHEKTFFFFNSQLENLKLSILIKPDL